MNRGSLLAPPNLLSLSRFALAAAFPVVGGEERLALLGAAAATDFLDGWIARHRGWVTRWGALLDPIADRVFVLTAVVTFLATGALTTTQVFLLLLRDIFTAMGFVVARAVPRLRDVPFRARWLGKVVTVLQLLVLVAVLVAPALVGPLALLVGALSVLAIADYTLVLWRERAR